MPAEDLPSRRMRRPQERIRVTAWKDRQYTKTLLPGMHQDQDLEIYCPAMTDRSTTLKTSGHVSQPIRLATWATWPAFSPAPGRFRTPPLTARIFGSPLLQTLVQQPLKHVLHTNERGLRRPTADQHEMLIVRRHIVIAEGSASEKRAAEQPTAPGDCERR
jgi:hypothetical protein